MHLPLGFDPHPCLVLSTSSAQPCLIVLILVRVKKGVQLPVQTVDRLNTAKTHHRKGCEHHQRVCRRYVRCPHQIRRLQIRENIWGCNALVGKVSEQSNKHVGSEAKRTAEEHSKHHLVLLGAELAVNLLIGLLPQLGIEDRHVHVAGVGEDEHRHLGGEVPATVAPVLHRPAARSVARFGRVDGEEVQSQAEDGDDADQRGVPQRTHVGQGASSCSTPEKTAGHSAIVGGHAGTGQKTMKVKS